MDMHGTNSEIKGQSLNEVGQQTVHENLNIHQSVGLSSVLFLQHLIVGVVQFADQKNENQRRKTAQQVIIHA